jgi:IclR family acetate operon transcriptional repressor
MQGDEGQPIRATTRTLDVLEFVGQQGLPATAAEIGTACDIPRSSLYKLLRVLEERGYLVCRPGDAGWAPGQRLLDLRSDSLLFVHGMAVLEALERGGGRLGVEDVAQQAELPRDLVERTLVALAGHGLVMPGYDGTFGLGLRFVSMASRVGWAERLQLAARPVLVRLRDETAETASLIVEDSGQALYMDQVESHFELRCRGWVGRRVPLVGTSVGAAFRDASCAHIVEDAVEPGVTAISSAAPGLEPKAGVNIIGPTWRLRQRGLAQVADLVCAAAGDLADAYAATLSPAL